MKPAARKRSSRSSSKKTKKAVPSLSARAPRSPVKGGRRVPMPDLSPPVPSGPVPMPYPNVSAP